MADSTALVDSAGQGRILIPEILLLVFKHATAGGDLPTICKLSSVCRWWRRLIYEAAWPWKDVRALRPVRPHIQDNLNRRDLKRIKICEKRCRKTLTHLNFRDITSRDSVEKALEILTRNKATLLDVEISEQSLCHCRACFPDRAYEAMLYGPRLSRSTIAASILKVIGQAPNLQRLYLSLALRHGIDWSVMEGDPLARPKHVTLDSNADCGNCPERGWHDWSAESLSFFEILTSEMEHFVEHSDGGCGLWEQWISDTLRRRSEFLRTCDVPVMEHSHLLPEIEFPRLQEASLRPFFRGIEHIRPLVLYYMPACKNLRSCPMLAIRMHCPEVTSAYLVVRGADDYDALPELLTKWQNLESLTLQVVGPREYHVWPTDDLRECLEILIPSRCGAIHAPKLRHFAIMQVLDQDWYGEHAEVHWATSPWSQQSLATLHHHSSVQDPSTGGCYALSADILHMIQERRRLSQGRDVQVCSSRTPDADSSCASKRICPALRGSCSALETIKIANFDVSPALWLALCQGNEAHVSCYPNPFTNDPEGLRPASSTQFRETQRGADALLKACGAQEEQPVEHQDEQDASQH